MRGVRITDQQRQRILSLRNKRTQPQIAAMVGCSVGTVNNVLNGTEYVRPGREAVAVDKRQPATAVSLSPIAHPDPSAPSTISDTSSTDSPKGDKPKADTVISDTASTDTPMSASDELAKVDKWIKKIEEEAEIAQGAGEMQLFGTLTSKLVSLLEHRRKVSPVPKPDPNENPDMIALGEQVWERLRSTVKSRLKARNG